MADHDPVSALRTHTLNTGIEHVAARTGGHLGVLGLRPSRPAIHPAVRHSHSMRASGPSTPPFIRADWPCIVGDQAIDDCDVGGAMADASTGQVFISYRRDDTQHTAGRLAE